MSDAVKYILDANIFIEAKRRYYAFDLCPGFWKCLLHHNNTGNLESVDRVRNELSEGDELDVWKEESPSFFAPTITEAVLTAYGEIIQWVQDEGRFSDAEKSTFAGGVDAWIIAYARANNCVVVTHERSAPRSTKIKIPDVCDHFDIKSTDTFDMLRKLEVVFDWGPS